MQITPSALCDFILHHVSDFGYYNHDITIIDQHALHNIVTASTPGRKRLQSRHPFSEHSKQLTIDAHGKTNRAWAEGTWETRWDTTRCRLRTIIQSPSNKPIGHDLARYSLVRLNRIRTGYGRFNAAWLVFLVVFSCHMVSKW